MNTKRYITGTLLLVLLLLLAACGGSNMVNEAPAEMDDSAGDTAEDIGEPPMAVGSERSGLVPEAPPEGEKVETERVVVEEVVVETAVESDVAVPGSPAALAEEVEVDRGEIDFAADSAAPGVAQNSRLTAGEVDDNAQWDDYLLYLRQYEGAAVIRVDVSERHQIWVQDRVGNPVLGARVDVLVDGEPVRTLRTHSNGRALFFPGALDTDAAGYTISVTVNDEVETFTIPADGSQREWTVNHPGATLQELPRVQLDVLFLIDATGSMADEINQLKENIRAIAAQIDALPAKADVRFGMVTYRDRGDQYVTRVTDFTPDVEAFARELASVSADGGGDYPEDLNEALFQAVHAPEWRVDDTVSLIFLVADAPPHLDYSQQNHYAVEMGEAATRGIKIYPIASSGLDSQGEYIFRQMAQFTGGRFIFLTYGASGPGSTGTETEMNVSDYTVGALDTLVVRIITEELSFLVQ